jgi:2,5-diamino-6-(ribosylamino)-4(3H)-pyrimidinone 5'-phosphate reductase
MAVGMSVDGRIVHRRDQLWFDEDAQRDWKAMELPSTTGLEEARSALIDRLYHPEATLEGSGSLARSTAGPIKGLPPVEPAEVLYTDFLPEEVVHRPGHEKWFTVIDSRGRVEWRQEDEGEWDVLVLVSTATPLEYLTFLRQRRLCYLVAGEKRVDLALALRKMKERLGVTCVKSTAGGGVNGALLRAGLIDEIHLIVSPNAIGGMGTPSIFDGVPLAKGELPTKLELLAVHAETDGMLWLRYEVAA